ncbi:MAG: SDR family oxidoreductase [Actinobacteria bacterium]|nr:SDR family oxidoreductase [Actinomycetota bacterium]
MTGEVLSGKAALITGANQGLGLEIARHYLDAGASVFVCARNAELLAAAHEELAARAGDADRVASATADVADAGQVEVLVATATERFPQLSILVNNAGIYGPKGSIEEVDWEQWKQAMEVNLYGSILPVRAILPQLRARGGGKIVQLSGGGATSPLPGLSSYAASKAAVVRFAETLALELVEDKIDVNSIAPGALNTRLLDEVLEAGPEAVGEDFYRRSLEQQESGGTPLGLGAELAVWLASPASDGITGRLLSAKWDPWRDLPEHRGDLSSDIYTLRRIVPADRGFDWGGD